MLSTLSIPFPESRFHLWTCKVARSRKLSEQIYAQPSPSTLHPISSCLFVFLPYFLYLWGLCSWLSLKSMVESWTLEAFQQYNGIQDCRVVFHRVKVPLKRPASTPKMRLTARLQSKCLIQPFHFYSLCSW